MPRTPSQHALARRALVEDVAAEASIGGGSRVRRSVAVVGISVLGLGVAGSLAVTGSAQNPHEGDAASISSISQAASSVSSSALAAGTTAEAFDRRGASLSRSNLRPALAAQAAAVNAARIDKAKQATHAKQAKAERDAKAKKAQAEKQAKAEKKAQAAKKALAKKKAKAAKKARVEKAARAQAARAEIAASKKTEAHATARKDAATSSHSTGHMSLPITSGFHIAARFGDTGSWSRYHTGLDFAAPLGTTIHAAAAGVVTHAGSGHAGWAGHYVAIRHADGKSTLYAHMSKVSVHVGEHVSGGERIGTVGMTGRTFGPHCHFELYPAGVTPGNLYKAINPAPWLRSHGLHF